MKIARRTIRRGCSLRLLLFPILLWAGISASAFTARDASTVFNSYNSAFYYQNGTNGWFKATTAAGIEYFWGQAEEIECIIDAYEWSSNSVYKAQITNLLNGFLTVNTANWPGYTPYNDDVMWAVIAFARGGVDTGNSNYCNLAKANFDACYARAYDTALGGGLYWKYPDNASKNACVNGPASIAAYLLYQIYGDTSYLLKATNIYAWERAALFDTNTGVVADNMGIDGKVYGGATTYNQGTFLGAAHFLGQTNDARLAANQAMMSMTIGGILPEYGIADNNSGFNAIFLRWLTRFMRDRNMQSLYMPWLQTNAAAAWRLRRTSDNLSWCQWLHPTPAGTNFDSWDCLSSLEILQAADPTQGSAPLAVPGNYIGYYPLDATNGTVAVDATGSGNTGLITNATWSAAGKINGCLSFNGVNSFVQISNRVWNDFTISFWVKTTQTGDGPQWYNGAGLVDGDVPFNNNDFGTALVGGKFAFGVGNPDTTVLSAATINNGAWHHVAATRQLATGALNVYVDGAPSGGGTGNRNTLNAPTRLLFGDSASGGPFFNGSLDEIKIFDRALTAAEVTALYSSTITIPPDAPMNLAAVTGNSQVSLSWSEATFATSYNVKRALVAGGPYVTLTNIVATTFTDMGVANNHTYYYLVSPVNVAGEGASFAEVVATPVAMVAWLKASGITNIGNGAGVTVWPDSTGNGFNAVQAIPGNQPTFASSAINGGPAVRFNSANSSYLWLGRPVQDDFTIICLFQSTQGLNSGTLYYRGAGLLSGEVGNVVNDFGTCLFANGSICAGTGNPDVGVVSGAGYNSGTPHVMTFKRIRSSGLVALYVDGNAVGTTGGGTQSLTAPGKLTLGAQQVLNNFFTGDIAEVQIYNAALSDTDRLGYERALKCKYGLAGGIAPAAPTGLTLAAGNRRISLNWTAAAGAAGYNVWRSTNSGASYELIANALATTSFVDTTAANGLVTSYKVMSSNTCGTGGFSGVAGILLPLPALGLSASQNSLTLTWPAWANDWNLQTTTNLMPPVYWWPITNTVGSNNGVFSVTIPETLQNQFFRLSSP